MILIRTICKSCQHSLCLIFFSHSICAGEIINLTATEEADRVTIHAENLSPLPVTIKLITSGVNIKSDCLVACIMTINSKTTVEADLIKPLNVKKEWRYKTHYTYSTGVVVEDYDSDFKYWPPFAHGEKFYLSQAFNGSFSHRGVNAIDFTMPEGTAIHAARAGLVTGVTEHFKKGGMDPDLKDRVNYVAIAHSDGTIGKYAHLRFNGAVVNPGDEISQGQLIAYSGATGYGMGPHLHFEVTRITAMGEMETLPFLIRSRRGLAEQPSLGYYYSVHRGQPGFEEIYADEIDFTEYFKRETPVNVSGVKNRQVNIDDHILVYIQNGKNNAIEVETAMILTGFRSIRPVPERLTINPGTEKLIAVIYQMDKKQESRFSFTYKYREHR